MNYEDITRIHPTLFLHQIGKHTGRIAGLGEPIEEGTSSRTAVFPVLLGGEEIGKYTVTAKMGIEYFNFVYVGWHPLAHEGENIIKIVYTKDPVLGGFARTDGRKKIVFPSQRHKGLQNDAMWNHIITYYAGR